MVRPSVLFRPLLRRVGAKWVALYGPDVHTGVSGRGETPAEAMRDFDIAWNESVHKSKE